MGDQHMADTCQTIHIKGTRNVPGDQVTAQATGRCRLNSREGGEVGAPWTQHEAVKEGRRQEVLDAMVMGLVHRPTQAGRNHVASSYF